MAEDSNGAESGSLSETLRRRGWYLEDTDQVEAIIAIQSALAHDRSKVVESVESELLNSDLRSIGAKSLPDPSLMRNPSYIHGPKVLQISSVKDIAKTCADDISRYSGGRRLLRLCLTDGHTEITAIEYSHIPFIPDSVHPGTKIRLENKVAVHSGIACLSPKVLTVLGGVVQPLYEEWQLNKKNSGFFRSSVRQLDNHDTGGPPPFVKLQVGSSSGYADYNSNSSKAAAVIDEAEEPEMRPTGVHRNLTQKADISDINLKSKLPSEKPEEKPSSSGTRPKEVVESVPVQNQAAAQKLLQKLNHPNQDDRHFKGRKHRGKGKQEDPVVFTLAEYERRRAQAKPLNTDKDLNISHDEHLAWQLQNQFNLEDSRVQGASHEAKAKAQDIRMSMFAYERDHGGSHQMAPGRISRGRGRGRGRGKGRGRYG